MKKTIGWFYFLLVISIHATAQMPANSSAAGLPVAEPDAKAFHAYASGNLEDLARWKSIGGDPARHAKEDPQAIYDAMNGDHGPAVLAYVLASGANPNAPRKDGRKGTPLHAFVVDLDKIRMLIDAGADINVRNDSGFTVLDLALISFGDEMRIPQYPSANQPLRVFKRVDVVRWLLAHGAGVNRQASDESGLDALQRTRRDDKEVIEILLQHGATLQSRARSTLDQPGKRPDIGPLTMAVLINRDDLALALLKRDRHIAENDESALASAARFGFTEIALALLTAGAQPDVVDDSGKAPLAWARKRRDTVLIAALEKAGAKSLPDERKTVAPGTPTFTQSVARAIYDVALMDSERFYLVGAPPKVAPSFVMVGKGENPYESMACEKSAAFRLIAFANEMGSIYVGVCRLEAGKLRGLAVDARQGIEKVWRQLSELGPDGKISSLRKAFGEWKQATLADGGEAFNFSVLLIGHGIIGLDTMVLVDKNAGRAIVVQAEISRLCAPEKNLRTPLCSDISGTFAEIAMRTRQLDDGK